jgi:hypothetical protein
MDCIFNSVVASLLKAEILCRSYELLKLTDPLQAEAYRCEAVDLLRSCGQLGTDTGGFHFITLSAGALFDNLGLEHSDIKAHDLILEGTRGIRRAANDKSVRTPKSLYAPMTISNAKLARARTAAAKVLCDVSYYRDSIPLIEKIWPNAAAVIEEVNLEILDEARN